jgi:hypothetical protein
METYKETYQRIKKLERDFIESALTGVVNIIKTIFVKPVNIGNMVYYYVEYNGREVPAYCYLSDYRKGEYKFEPIYDELGYGEFGWADFEEVARILDLIKDVK